MATTYSIFGSCVTRDMFGFGADSDLIDCYIARCAIASAVSGGVEFPIVGVAAEGLSLLSPFEQRMIRGDVEKSCFQKIDAATSGSIIVDLIDERFSLIDIGGGYITESASFVKAGLGKVVSEESRKLTFFEREAVDRGALVAFAEKLKATGKDIVLHNAFWATFFVEDGAQVEFEKSAYYSRMNEELIWRYALLKELIPDAAIIEAPVELRLADPRHRWGLAPFHYIPEYYDFVRSQLGL